MGLFKGSQVTIGSLNMHILLTKLNRPALDSKWVERPHLTARLNEGLKKRLTLISTPAGYGKTTLVAQWIDQITEKSAWLSLEREDSDPDRFLRYLVAAVRKSFPKFSSKIESFLQTPILPPPDFLADTVISELAALKKPLVIVFEDFHAIESESVQKIFAPKDSHPEGGDRG